MLKHDRAKPLHRESLLRMRTSQCKLISFCKDLVTSREAKENVAVFLGAGAWTRFALRRLWLWLLGASREEPRTLPFVVLMVLLRNKGRA